MQEKSIKTLFSGFSAVLIVAGVALGSSSAHAGFQWVPSSGDGAVNTYQNQMATAPVPRSAPVPTVQRVQPRTTPFDSMPTVQIDSVDEPVAAAHASSRNLVPPRGAMPVADVAMDAPVAPMGMDDKPLKGFANNVPLSVALRQILPQELGYSVAPDVSMGTLVSWKGGDTWRNTLNKVLGPSGLAMQEKGQVVHIVRSMDSGTRMVDNGATSAMVRPVARMGAAPSIQSLKAGGKPMTLGTLSSHEADEPSFDAPITGGAPASVSPAAGYGQMVVNSWRADRGETLRKVFERWAQGAGVEVVWQAEYDYPLQASVSLSGTFEGAVRDLLLGFQDAKPQPTATLHASQSGGAAVLVVGVRGNNYSE